jgi:hypothetical protein
MRYKVATSSSSTTTSEGIYNTFKLSVHFQMVYSTCTNEVVFIAAAVLLHYYYD